MFEFLRQGRVARPHRVNPTFPHPRLMTLVAELRLQRLDFGLRTLAFANRALLCAVDVALQTRIRSAFPLDLQQRALLRGLQARLGQRRAAALFVESGGEIGAGLRKGGIPFAAFLLQPRDFAFQRFARRPCGRLRLLEFLDANLRGEQGARALLERRPGARQIRLQGAD